MHAEWAIVFNGNHASIRSLKVNEPTSVIMPLAPGLPLSNLPTDELPGGPEGGKSRFGGLRARIRQPLLISSERSPARFGLASATVRINFKFLAGM